MTDKERANIIAHGKNLLAIFPNARERDPLTLCKRLRALERRAATVALRLCNGPEYKNGYDEADALFAKILANVAKILGPSGPPVFINCDPRGYQLKIRYEWMRDHPCSLHKDWGGYGIIAPDLSERGDA